MFYKTQISKIGTGGAIDTQGKRLRFCGNLPVGEGDWVWTDGQVIFGHVPIRDTQLIFSDGGYPIIGEDKQGYLSSSGEYKKSYTVNDDWITNNKNYFKHGQNDIDGHRIIDSQVGDNGELYIATDGIYRKNDTRTYHNHLYLTLYKKTAGHEYDQIDEVTPLNLVHAVESRIKPYVGEEITLGVSDPDENTDILFFKDDEQINNLNLKQFADSAENLAIQIKDQIMSESNKEDGAVNWALQPPPPTDFFIASSYARVVTLNIQKSGDWDAVISASSYGYCFPYLTLNGSIFAGAFPNGEDQIPNQDLAQCLDNFETIVYIDKSLPFSPNIVRYPAYAGQQKTTDDTGKYVYTDGYVQHSVGAIEYYIPLARFRHYLWGPMLFSACIICHVRNGKIVKTIFSDAGGGSRFYNAASHDWTERGLNHSIASPQFVKKINAISNTWEFPLIDDWYFQADGLTIKNIINKNNDQKISVGKAVNSTLHRQFYEAYYQYPISFAYAYDKVAEDLAKEVTDTGNPEVLYGYIRLTPRLHYKYVALNSVEDVYDFYPKKESNSFLSGWFRKDDEDYAGDEIRLSHCFARIGDGKYIIGVRGGNLLSVSRDSIKTICDKLKNFRLAKLNNLGKSKK